MRVRRTRTSNRGRRTAFVSLAACAALLVGAFSTSATVTYPIVDTGQVLFYDAADEITEPGVGDDYYGQDAHYEGSQPDLTLSGDGLTVHDNVTGLTWMASPDGDGDGTLESPDDKMSWWDAMDYPATLNAQSYGGYDDWRLPSIKELYSLIDFRGVDPSGYTGGTSGLIPFIDTDYFEFVYGDESAGERIIDSQYWTTTEYVGLTMGGDHTVFGVNFADGRIKGYPTSDPQGGIKLNFALCCRGSADYGVNEFEDNGDGTVTDAATGLMWQQGDSGSGMLWEDALAYAEGLTLAGHDDWRLPNVKELQSIVDYTRSPQTTDSPAIDPIFSCTAITDEGGGTDYPFYWSGTTHSNWSQSPGEYASYVAFGEALGWMQSPFPPYDYALLDVHGAGAQRSDPKSGDPADYPYGHGPQGDVIRIDNFVRCVRDADSTEVDVPGTQTSGLGFSPNPFTDTTELEFVSPAGRVTSCAVYDVSGRRVATLTGEQTGGAGSAVRYSWDGTSDAGSRVATGVYFAELAAGGDVERASVVYVR